MKLRLPGREPAGQRLHGGARLHAQLVLQPAPVLAGDPQRLRPIAGRRQRPHESSGDPGVVRILAGPASPPAHGRGRVGLLLRPLGQRLERLPVAPCQTIPHPLRPLLEGRGVREREPVQERPLVQRHRLLEPGIYFVECYVLGEDGVFHTLRMVEKLVVTEASSGGGEPRATLRVSIDDDGIEMEESQGPSGIRPGQHTVAVTFEENGTPSGNDLHLIRLEEGTSVAEVNAWMDWPDTSGPNPLASFYDTDDFGPALTSYHGNPGPQTWLGGVQDIRPPLPETAYFRVRLTPGEYAWVAELPNPEARGFLETFTVPHGTETGG